MQRYIYFLFLLGSFISTSYNQERRTILTCAQLRKTQRGVSQAQQEESKNTYYGPGAREGIAWVLGGAPICAIGVCLFGNAAYQLHNFENKCWVQPVPTITPEMCNLLAQMCCGFLVCEVGVGCYTYGCQKACQSRICNEKDCCTRCMKECCGLLGIRR